MIWESTLVMALFDVTIVLVVGYAVVALIRYRFWPRCPAGSPGPVLLAVGLGMVGAFYAAHLIVLAVVPTFMPAPRAAEVAELLHLDVHFFVSIASALMLAAGAMVSTRSLREGVRRRIEVAERLSSLHDEERRSIARDLHDEMAHRLTAIKFDLGDLQIRLKDTCGHETTSEVDGLLASIEDSLGFVRQLAGRIRPPLLDRLGLLPALEWLAEDAARSGVQISFEAVVGSEAVPGGTAAEVVYRVAQEALTNALRHAGATHVRIRLTQGDETVNLEVRDDGVGVPEEAVANPRSLGFIGMFERALAANGELKIWGQAEGGTVVCLRVPHSAIVVPRAS